jgi:hypothetical protein
MIRMAPAASCRRPPSGERQRHQHPARIMVLVDERAERSGELVLRSPDAVNLHATVRVVTEHRLLHDPHNRHEHTQADHRGHERSRPAASQIPGQPREQHREARQQCHRASGCRGIEGERTSRRHGRPLFVQRHRRGVRHIRAPEERFGGRAQRDADAEGERHGLDERRRCDEHKGNEDRPNRGGQGLHAFRGRMRDGPEQRRGDDQRPVRPGVHGAESQHAPGEYEDDGDRNRSFGCGSGAGTRRRASAGVSLRHAPAAGLPHAGARTARAGRADAGTTP